MITPRPESRRFLTGYILVAATSFVLLVALWAAVPPWRDFITRENGPIESLTVVVLVAGVVTSLAAIRSARRVRRPDGVMVFLAAACLLAALEELSYGKELFPNLPFPTVLGVELDAVHDLADVAAVAFARIGAVPFLSVIAVATALSIVVLRRLPVHRIAWDDPRTTLIGIAIGLGILSQALDAFRASRYLEETFELEAAITLLFAALLGMSPWSSTSAEATASRSAEAARCGDAGPR